MTNKFTPAQGFSRFHQALICPGLGQAAIAPGAYAPPNYARWVARHHAIIRNIAPHDRSSGNDYAIADGHARPDHRACTDETVPTYRHGSGRAVIAK